jgi:hypothetical protein
MMTVKKKTLFMVIGVALVILCMSSSAWSCPWCDGGPTEINRVKAGIFNEAFVMRAAAVLAPFPIFGGIVALIYFGPPNIRRSKKD